MSVTEASIIVGAVASAVVATAPVVGALSCALAMPQLATTQGRTRRVLARPTGMGCRLEDELCGQAA
ncbi:MAG: hypothetical protein ACK4S5_12765, partial [Sphingobium yanoikuyae]